MTVNIKNIGTVQVGIFPSCLYPVFIQSTSSEAIQISAMPTEHSDSDLLELIHDGDKSAFTELVNRHAGRFYRIAFRFLNNRDNAEDIVQDAFLKLWNNTAKWKRGYDAKFTTWFSRIVINLCLDFRKKNSRIQDFSENELRGSGETPYEAVKRRLYSEMLYYYIDQLPERQQTAINLCFYEGFSNKEAAEIMEINVKALESLLMRAKAGLREKIISGGGA